jgi:hypothetical protein
MPKNQFRIYWSLTHDETAFTDTINLWNHISFASSIYSGMLNQWQFLGAIIFFVYNPSISNNYKVFTTTGMQRV